MGEVKEKVMDLVLPILKEKGLELVDVEYVKEGSDYFLRILMDHPDGIGHNHCKEVSEELSPLLDLYELLPESYFLEVSSPGIERPLKKEDDYRRFCGKKVNIKTFGPIKHKREWQGELLGLQEGMVHLLVDDEEMEIPIKQIANARLMVDL